jgi:hypothetical protein
VAALARGLAGAAPTGHDDEHPATFAFKIGQQARVAETRSAHTWPGQATSHAAVLSDLPIARRPTSYPYRHGEPPGGVQDSRVAADGPAHALRASKPPA